MEKLNIPKFDEEKYDLDKLLSTKYDYLFRDVIKERGIGYYRNNIIEKFHKKDNVISAIIKGSKDYNVSIKFIGDNDIEVSCECEYHKSTDKYCKHVYSLLLNLKLLYEKEKMLEVYNKNLARINEISSMIQVLLHDNQKYINFLVYGFHLNIKNHYENYLKELEEFIDKNNIFKVRSALRYSFEYLAGISEKYNEVIDDIEEGKRKLEEKRKKEEIIEDEIEEEDEDEGILECTKEADEILEGLDNLLASLPVEVLEEYKKNNLEIGNDVSMFDKAIEERKRRNQLEKLRDEEFERERAKWNRRARRAAFFGFLGGLFEGLSEFNNNSSTYFDDSTDYLMPWEKDLVDKGEYEPYQFEEEDMDEDDYYYEDE